MNPDISIVKNAFMGSAFINKQSFIYRLEGK